MMSVGRILYTGGACMGALLAAGADDGADLDRVFEGRELERIATGFGFTEGPVWHKKGYLLFSDIPGNHIHRWAPDGQCTLFRDPSGNSNGLTLDRKGRLLACEHGNRRVTRTEVDGKVTVLADHFEGKRLNSPNDIIERKDGTLFFTDPPYGITPEQQELPFNGVYRIDRDGVLTAIARDFERPNGLALSPDEKTLYIVDTTRHHVRAFDLKPDGAIANSRILFRVPADLDPLPDGMKVDVKGNLYITANPAGLWVVAPDGKLLAHLKTPEPVANCAFGGPDNRTLFLTATTSVYRIRTRVAGVPTY